MSFYMPPSEPCITSLGTKFSPRLGRFEISGAPRTFDREFLSCFPHLFRNFTLFFPSFIGFKPFSSLFKLFSSFVKVKSSFLPVPFKMIGTGHHFQVFYFIVVFVAIFMVNIHSFWYRSEMVDPNPSVRMNWHYICPITILLFVKLFAKVSSTFQFRHHFLLIREWLVSLSHLPFTNKPLTDNFVKQRTN